MFKLVKDGFSRGFAMRSIKNETIDDIMFILMNLLLFVMSHFMLNLAMGEKIMLLMNESFALIMCSMTY
jgi:hypothetical protein